MLNKPGYVFGLIGLIMLFVFSHELLVYYLLPNGLLPVDTCRFETRGQEFGRNNLVDFVDLIVESN